MSVRTSFIGIVAVGALITALVAGLVQAHESSPPSLGDTIEVSPSSAVVDGRNGTETPAPGPSSSPKPSVPTTAGGDAVPPPPVPPGDDDGSYEDDGSRGDDGSSGDNDRDDDDRDDG